MYYNWQPVLAEDSVLGIIANREEALAPSYLYYCLTINPADSSFFIGIAKDIATYRHNQMYLQEVVSGHIWAKFISECADRVKGDYFCE